MFCKLLTLNMLSISVEFNTFFDAEKHFKSSLGLHFFAIFKIDESVIILIIIIIITIIIMIIIIMMIITIIIIIIKIDKNNNNNNN